MTILSGYQINAQDIVDTFAGYVTAYTGGIDWGIGQKPFPEFPDGYFGGYAGSWPLGISGGNIGYPGYPISASTIYSVLLSETTSYTRIRNLRAIRNIQGDTVITQQQKDAYGNPMYDAYGNPIMITTVINYSGPGDQSLGTTGTGGINFDQAGYAYMNSSYTQSISVGGSDLYSGGTITAGGLTNFFYDLRSAYISAKENQITVRIDVCHNSCHNSCHGSRGRR